MNVEQMLWAREHEFWGADAGFYERNLARDCVMMLPPPGGMLAKAEIVEAIARSSRWFSIEMTHRRTATLGDGAMALIYRAKAQRDGDSAPYATLASSCYVKRGRRWMLVMHQQTPLQGRQW